MDTSIIKNTSISKLLKGISLGGLSQQPTREEDLLQALFEETTTHLIWVTDDETQHHSVFVNNTNGVNKDKLLEVINKKHLLLMLWHLDGVMFQQRTACDCALLHDKIMHFVEFKANALNASETAIESNYDKAVEQITKTFDRLKSLYQQQGLKIWDIFLDIDARIVFSRTIPQNNSYQKKIREQFLEENLYQLLFENSLVI